MPTPRYTRRKLSVLVGIGAVGRSGCLGEEDDDSEADPADDDSEDDAVTVDDQPDDAAPMFVVPEDGDTVSAPVELEAEVEGIERAPAGEAVVGEGHLHVLVDRECFEEGETIPSPSDEAEADGIYRESRQSASGSSENLRFS